MTNKPLVLLEVQRLTTVGWRQWAPNSVALNVPASRDVLSTGGANLSFPRGGSANGIPRHALKSGDTSEALDYLQKTPDLKAKLLIQLKSCFPTELEIHSSLKSSLISSRAQARASS